MPVDVQRLVRLLPRALRRAETGRSVSRDEAAALCLARGDDLERLLVAARTIRDTMPALHGPDGRPRITYSRKVFVPLTHLCRDACGYCTFAWPPKRDVPAYLSPDQVIDIVRRGAEQGCKEVLFTLGDRPEVRHPAARQWLDERGYDSTVGYLRSVAIQVVEATGLLPHLNAGVLSWTELALLKPVSASMGLMLESTSTALLERGGAHHAARDTKTPAARLAMVEDAGRQAIPFTSGLLVGIGETVVDRADTVLALRDSHRRHGHLQEVIVQNFRAKPGTAMAGHPEPGLDELLATIAMARLLLGPKVHVQAPPNLSPGDEVRLLDAGIDDLGGISPVTPDHVNPEAPWPHLDTLADRLADHGWALTERLCTYPEYVQRPDPWLAAKMQGPVAALAIPSGLADPTAIPVGHPWQELGQQRPDEPAGHHLAGEDRSVRLSRPLEPGADRVGGEDRSGRRVADEPSVDHSGGGHRPVQRAGGEPALDPEVHGDVEAAVAAAGGRATLERGGGTDTANRGLDRALATALARAQRGGHVPDATALALFDAVGPGLDALAEAADEVRADRVGDAVTYVVNRNINFTNVCYVGCRFCAFAQRRDDHDAYELSLDQVADRAAEAAERGATEVCLQGGIHPDLPGTHYLDILDVLRSRTPQLHVHAFSPMEVVNGASRMGVDVREFLTRARDAGLGSVPGTAAEILDDEVRWVLTRGKLPAATWVEVVTTAHDLGIHTTSTMMFGHVDAPRHWVAHLQLLRRVQEESLATRAAAFTEFVPLPFVHQQSPIHLAGVARAGPGWDDVRRVHAVARLVLAGAIDHVQLSWVKVGLDRAVDLLRGGCDDLGGTLMDETISRMAGADHGTEQSPAALKAVAERAGRPVHQRTTLYAPALVGAA